MRSHMSLPPDVSLTNDKRKRPEGRDLTGSQFGMLEVVRYVGRKPNKSAWYECHCDCGKVVFIRQDRLITNKKPARSCGCQIVKRGSDSNRWTGHEEIYGNYWGKIKKNAKVRGLEFRLSIGEAWDLFIRQGRRCALTGVELYLRGLYNRGGNASLDRIDSSRGYSIDNVQWVLTEVNRAKMNMKDADFIGMCCLVVNHAFNGILERKIRCGSNERS